MPSFLEKLRLNNLFQIPQGPLANDLPEQGGFGGNMGRSPGMPPLPFGTPDIFGGGPATIRPPAPLSAPEEVFKPPGMPNAFETSQVPTPAPGINVNSVADMYTPEDEAKNRLNDLMNAYPKRGKVSLLRNIAAGIIGATKGHQVGRQVLDQKFNQDLFDWKNQIGIAEKMADNENNRNVNSRNLAYQTVTQQIKEQVEEAKRTNDTAKLKILDDRNKLLDFKQRNPAAKFAYPKGGNIQYWDPNAKAWQDTGVSSGTITDLDKLVLGHEYRMEEGAQRGSFQIQIADKRAAAADDKGWQILEMDDPANPGKKIPVRINVNTGEKQPIEGIGQVQKLGTSKNVQPPNLQNIQDKAQETLNALGELLQGEGDKSKINPMYSQAVGKSRMLPTHWIPGSKGRTGESKIKRVKDLLTLELLSELKAQSKTGATAFGQLNIKELGLLEAAASNLDPAMDEPEFLEEMKRIREKLKKILLPADGMTENKTEAPKRDPDKLIEHYSRPGGK